MTEEAPAFSEPDLVQSICRESFFEFVKEFWEVIIPEEPVWNWHIPYLCEELQEVAERVFREEPKEHDVIINIPPGTTKSTICSIMYPAWIWTRMPWARIIGTSYEHLLALTFARKSRDIVESEKYRRCFRFKYNKKQKRWLPSMDKDAVPLVLKDDQNTKGFYENMARGDRKSVGSGGQITGSHGHFILVDDPINPKEAVSEPVLKTVNAWIDETLPTRKVNKSVTPTILIMQRLHENDPTGHLLAKKKASIRHICLPDRLRDNVHPKALRIRYKQHGGLLDPVRLSEAVLKEQLMDLGLYGYAGQFEQSPVPLEAGMFQVGSINIRHQPPLNEFTDIVRYWDKAGTAGGGAYSAGAKLGLHKTGSIWILDVDAEQLGISERNARMKQTADADGFRVRIGAEVEPGSGGKESAFYTVVEVLKGYRVYLDKVTGSKVVRAEPLAGQVGVGNVYAPIGAPWWEALREEMKFFPNGKYKDRTDACSGAYAMLMKGFVSRRGRM